MALINQNCSQTVDEFNEMFNESHEVEESELNKTSYEVHASSFSEQDFGELINCMEQIRKSYKKKRGRRSAIRNYCVQVPTVDNSQTRDSFHEQLATQVDEKCEAIRSNISQMFSYFEEDVHIELDDDEQEFRVGGRATSGASEYVDFKELNNLNNENVGKSNDLCEREYRKFQKFHGTKISVNSSKHESLKEPATETYEDFHQKFIRNRSKIKEFQEASINKPIIREMLKKPTITQSVLQPPAPTALNKNQVDKIMNEFNRVKINYYSKDNYVEFTDIDYFYAESDSENKDEKLGRLDKAAFSKFQPRNTEIMVNHVLIPHVKNSVKDKIEMFSKLDVLLLPADKKSLANKPVVEKNEKISNKNMSNVSKNQNKCFIKDINESLMNEVPKSQPTVIEQFERPPQIPPRRPIIKNEVIGKKKATKSFDKLNLSFPIYVKASAGQSSTKIKKCQSIKLLNKENPINITARIRAMLYLNTILSYVKLNNIPLMLSLEKIIGRFNVSIMQTIIRLIRDDAFTLKNCPTSLIRCLFVHCSPSIAQFSNILSSNSLQLEFIDLKTINSHITLQLHIKDVKNVKNIQDDDIKINVIFMAKYQKTNVWGEIAYDCDVQEGVSDKKTLYIYFTSFFEVFCCCRCYLRYERLTKLI